MSGAMPPTSIPPTNIGAALSPPAPIQIELYIDLICPFSAKMFIALYDSDIFKEYEGKVSFVMQNTPQPWHPQGVYLHEVALAVKVHQPELFAKVVRAIYEAFAFGKGKFTDADTYDKSRAQIYEEALDVAASAGADRALIAEKVKLLTLKPAPGVEVQATTSCTQDIKWAVKRQRKMGVHVTPTVFINGLEAGIVSSGWTGEQWKAFLTPLGADHFNTNPAA